MGKGKKAKPFIQKKNASTYHLMHRSQRDVAGDLMMMNGEEMDVPISSTGMVLWPGDNNLPETNKKVLFSITPLVNEQQTNKQQQHSTINTNTSDKQHSSLREWRTKLEAVGLLETEDEAGDRFLKPITGTGTFLDARSGKVSVNTSSVIHQQQKPQQELLYEEEALMEVERVFDSIPLTADCMDPDIAAVLFGDDVDGILEDFEEMNDDFVLMAAQEPTELNEHNDEATNNCNFDYDEHIRRLLEKAKRNPSDAALSMTNDKNHPGQHDKAYFSSMKPLRENGDDDEVDSWDNENYDDEDDHITTTTTSGFVVSKLTPEEERALCEKIEQTFAEYDDDSSDFDDHHDNVDVDQYMNNDDIHSNYKNEVDIRPKEVDKYVESAIDEYLIEKDDDVYIQGVPNNTRRKNGGSGFTALINQNLHRGTEWKDGSVPRGTSTKGDDNDEAPPVDVVLALAKQRLLEPPVRPPDEDVLFDGKSYFSERQRNPWDCESILTTYSNLDNNPATIGRNDDSTSRRRRRQRNKEQKQQLTEGPTLESNDNNDLYRDNPIQHQPIKLSTKTGLPVGVYDSNKNQQHVLDDGHHDNDIESRGGTTLQSLLNQKRDRNETPDIKKVRKLLVKQERCMSRIQKKVSKEVFSEEFCKKRAVPLEDISGKTVFRYS